MTNPNAAHIAVVLDRSGSMSPIASDTIKSLNAFVAEQRKLPGDIKFTLTLFNTEHETMYSAAPLPMGDALTAETYKPAGGTALYDAISQTVIQLGKDLAAMPEHQRPARVVVVILTDGEENSSRYYTHATVAELIKRQRTVYSWEFIFLGAELNAEKVAASINIPAASAMVYANTSGGIHTVLRSAGAAVASYVSTGAATSFSAETRAENAPAP